MSQLISDGIIKYREIAGYPHYHVGDDGTVWSKKLGNEFRQLRPNYSRMGYPSVSLCSNKVGKKFHVHRLILIAFKGNPGKGFQTRHINGDRRDCRLVNLEWGTASQNALDKIRHGTHFVGSGHPNSKLIESEVLQIKTMYRKGKFGYKRLGKMFNVDYSVIREIMNGGIWKHVNVPC